jgi:hypothetical protein
MANFENTIGITGPVSPIDERDTYPTHFARLGKGGFYRVATLADRNLISDDRREQGLTVLVTDDLNPGFNRAYTLDGGITNDDWVEWVVTPNYLNDWKQNGTFPNNPNIICDTITASGDGTFYNVLVYNSVRLGKVDNRLQVVPSGVQLFTNNIARLTATEDGKLVTYSTYVPTEAKSLVTKDFVEQLIGSGGGGGGSDIPNTPINLTPTNGTNNLGTGDASITFTASVYFSPIASAMTASQWRFSTTADFTVLLHTTGDRAGTSTSYTLNTPLTVLGTGKTVYWQVRYKDSTNAYSNWSSPTTFTTTTTDPAPNQPTNISPVNNATDVGDRGNPVTLTGSTYSSAVNSPMTAAQWQLTTTTDAGYATPVISTGDIGGTAVSYTIPNPNAVLGVNTTYRWRIRYKDSAGQYSAWSSSTTFTTASSFTRLPPFTPINELPVNGATNQGANATAISLKATAYNSPESSPMAAGQWQITSSADTNFNNVIVDTGDILGTSIERVINNPSSILQPNTVYRWRVRYKDSNGLYSGWSSATTFTTAGSFALLVAPQTPSNVSPANLATNLGYNQAAIVLQGSPYQHTRNIEMAARQFQITSSADTSFNDVIVNTNEISGNQLTYVLNDPSLVLSTSTTYRWRVRYKSLEGVWSNWSTSTRFTTANTFANDVPVIITQPTSIEVAVGSTATFFISATGTNLTYQWRKNNSNITGATAPLYTFTAQSGSPGGYTCVVSNPAGSVTSDTAQLTLRLDAPTIIQQPQDLTVRSGTTASFNVVVTGSTPLSYQWRKNGVNISGATNASYNIPFASDNDAGVYSVVVSNSVGSVTSSGATLTIAAVAPTITNPPQNQTVNQGSPATFSVTAVGTSPMTYQWRKDGVNISGATNNSYVISSATTTNVGAYSVVVTNSAGSAISSSATLTVNTPPTIVQQPSNTVVTQGSTATFSVTATGTTPLSYQWKKSVNGVYTNISGATQSTYSISSADKAADETSYQVAITNTVGTVTSNNVTLTVNLNPPVIVDQPQNLTVNEGNNATFTVSVSGVGPFTYQWRKGTSNISGATASSLTLSNTTSADQASYSVIVSGPGGSVTSSSASLTVISRPVINTQPTDTALPLNASGSLFVGATGANLTYQWRKAGVAIVGATSPLYSFVMGNDTAGSYTCTVTNSAGSVTSSAANVTLQATAPVITQQPQGVTIDDGNVVYLTVTADSLLPLSYQWRRNGSNISGATTSTYQFVAAEANAGTYSVVISNSAGSTTSANAVVTTRRRLPVILAPTANLSVVAGNSITLRLENNIGTSLSYADRWSLIDGTGSFTYQWAKDGINISGATNTTYTITNADADDAGVYSVTVTNARGDVSSSRQLNVTVPLVITQQPAATQICYPSTSESYPIEVIYQANAQQPVTWYSATYGSSSFSVYSAPTGSTYQTALGNNLYKATLVIPATTTNTATNFKARIGGTSFIESNVSKLLRVKWTTGYTTWNSINELNYGGVTSAGNLIYYVGFFVPNTYSEVGTLNVTLTASIVSGNLGTYVRPATPTELNSFSTAAPKYNVNNGGTVTFTVPANNTYAYAFFVVDGTTVAGQYRMKVEITTNYGDIGLGRLSDSGGNTFIYGPLDYSM